MKNFSNLFLNRRNFIVGTLALLSLPSYATVSGKNIQVWKSPQCGCCTDWIDHLKRHGFSVQVTDVERLDRYRAKNGMPARYASCHTAMIDGYAIEGHVPAFEIERLLQIRPVAIGLSVPGMPVGSPGMDGPEFQGRQDPYDVLLVKKDASYSIFAHYPN